MEGGSTKGKPRLHRWVISSMLLQLALGAFLSHSYDTQIFMVVGKAVAEGQSPYSTYLMQKFFHHYHFWGISYGISYPPIVGLTLGLIYLISYNIFNSLVLYNFVLKVPVIIGNIGLAYLVGRICTAEDFDSRTGKQALIRLLFNPFILYTTTLWGMFDTTVALFMVLSLYLLSMGRHTSSAICFAIALNLKTYVFALLPLPFLFLWRNHGLKKALKYALVLSALALTIALLPLLVLWPEALQDFWLSQSTYATKWAGGFSLYNIIDLLQDLSIVDPIQRFFLENPKALNIAGQAAGSVSIIIIFLSFDLTQINEKVQIKTFKDLCKYAAAFMILFFLFRPYVSEQNLNIVMPFLLLYGMYSRDLKSFQMAWVISFCYAIVNALPLQFLWLIKPETVDQTSLICTTKPFSSFRYLTRFLLVLCFYAASWLTFLRDALRPVFRGFKG